MSCASLSPPDRRRPRIVLLGNPNVGKSALFNALTGARVTVSNYPGTTVEVQRGRLPDGTEIIDSPGTNSLFPLTEDEAVTFALLRGLQGEPGSVVLQVADAKNLRRALVITLELGQAGLPAVLALNMADEAEACGIAIDLPGLATAIGVPVLATVATLGRGVPDLVAAFAEASIPRNHLPLPAGVGEALLPILGHSSAPPPTPLLAAYHEAMLGHAEALARRFTRGQARTRTRGARFSRGLGRLAVHPLWGWPLLLLVLAALYAVVGRLGAGVLVDLVEGGLFGRYLNPAAVALFGYLPWALARDLFVGEYGMITMGLRYGLALVLPIVTTFFTAFALLEDSGYLPRLCVMSDRLLRLMGLNGKAVLPMVLGLGCDTMATLTTRILETRKERVLVTLLLALGVPCSAQLGVLLAMLGRIPPSAVCVWVAAVLGVMLLVGALGARLLPGETSPFLLELPPLRRPSLQNVLVKTAARVEWYLREALPLFVVGTLCLFVLARTGLLEVLIRAGEPIVKGVLGLPKEASEAFLIGFLRRDFAATRLFELARHGALDTVQIVVAMVTVTLFIPCIANVFMIAKERGLKTALGMSAFVFPFAFAVGGLVRMLMNALGAWGTP